MRTGCGSDRQVVSRGANGDQKLLWLLNKVMVTEGSFTECFLYARHRGKHFYNLI